MQCNVLDDNKLTQISPRPRPRPQVMFRFGFLSAVQHVSARRVLSNAHSNVLCIKKPSFPAIFWKLFVWLSRDALHNDKSHCACFRVNYSDVFLLQLSPNFSGPDSLMQNLSGPDSLMQNFMVQILWCKTFLSRFSDAKYFWSRFSDAKFFWSRCVKHLFLHNNVQCCCCYCYTCSKYFPLDMLLWLFLSCFWIKLV